jgi:cytochrome P450
LTARRALLPPGPRGHWLVGSLPEFGRDLLGFLAGCAYDYGDVVHFRLGRRPAYLLNRPELIEQVLVDKQGTFIKHSFFWRHARRLFGAGLLTSEGDHWRRQHRLITPAFQAQQLERYAPTVVERTEAMLAGWRSGDRLDLLREMGRLTLRIVARVLFDLDLAHDVDRLGRAVDRGIEALARRFQSLIVFPEWLPTPANRGFHSSIREFDVLVAAMIEARRDGGSPGEDLFSRMMQARDDEGRPMTDRQLRDEAVTLLLAGHETTAVALAWTCWLLARYPDAAAKAASEADEVLRDHSAGAADLPHLRVCARAISEALRLYPPAYVIGRETVRPCEIGGYSIPAGATLFMSQWVMHRDPRFYEQPDAFVLERWEEGRCERLPRFAFFPFGGGPRICIGSRFAMMEATLVLATMLRRFRLVAISDAPIRPLPLVTLRPQGGVPLAAIAR